MVLGLLFFFFFLFRHGSFFFLRIPVLVHVSMSSVSSSLEAADSSVLRPFSIFMPIAITPRQAEEINVNG